MVAQRGKDLLLKIDEDGDGNFTTLAGLRTRRIAFNAETVDITDAESAGRWRELLGGAGVQRAALSGSGIFKDAASDANLRQIFFDGRVAPFQAVIPDFGTISGLQQRHRERVSEDVRRDGFARQFRPAHCGRGDSSPDNVGCAETRQAGFMGADEERTRRSVINAALAHQCLQSFDEIIRDRHDPFLPALAAQEHLRSRSIELKVAGVDADGRLLVRLARGVLSSIDRQTLLEGGNLCAVESGSGAWEVLQFQSAEEVEPQLFEASLLLRAQGGTEDAMEVGAAIGAPFVLLDAACGPLGLTTADVGRPTTFRISPFGRRPDDPATVTLEAELGGCSVRPLSPVHLKASFEPDGAVAFSWIRRTRIGGDGWNGLDVPLGEERELYRATVASNSSSASYDLGEAALQLSALVQREAFGGLPQELTLTVAQVSPVWGAGTARSATFVRPGA